ncbi:hypothetical protein D9757_004976 [Collybiopsis confluens]|uniref:Uncharacterized protein n=1 Tax=Collybiopsis confluens TaxID=2823264 RepID=A0A8H5HT58_9AGAR|nr:hypothetical protein D9757_004976 [Collybiopsis confluens]
MSDVIGAPYDSYGCFQPTLIVLMIELVSYGAYAVIFGLYVYLEVRQRGRQRFYQTSLSILFVLSTVALGLSISKIKPKGLACSANFYSGENFIELEDHWLQLSQQLQIAVEGVYAAANVIADTLILYRCYVVWASRKWVIAGPTLLCAINTGMAITSIILQQKEITSNSWTSYEFGFVGSLFFEGFMAINFVSNLILTGLIAGRISWINRANRKNLGYNKNDKRGSSAIAIILESGLLYPLALIPCAIFQLFFKGMGLLEPQLTVIVGLAPTLMIVRLNLQISTATLEDTTNAINYKTQSDDLERLPLSDFPLPLQSSEELPQHFLLSMQENPAQEISDNSHPRMINPLPRKYQDSQLAVEQNVGLGGTSRRAK